MIVSDSKMNVREYNIDKEVEKIKLARKKEELRYRFMSGAAFFIFGLLCISVAVAIKLKFGTIL